MIKYYLNVYTKFYCYGKRKRITQLFRNNSQSNKKKVGAEQTTLIHKAPEYILFEAQKKFLIEDKNKIHY